MSKIADIIGTSLTSFQIGAKQTGAKVLRFVNGSNTGSLSWTPSTNRTLTLPDKTDTLAGLSDIGFSVFTVSGSTRNIGLPDAYKTLYCTNPSPLIITVPTHASVSLTVGTVIEVIQATTNSVTITASSGVTLSRLNSTDNSHQLTGQWCVAQLKKVAADAWIFFFKSPQGSSSPSYSFLLDAVPNPTIACSSLKLSSAASSCATIRRSSDNTTQALGFVSGTLDSASALSFGGAGNTFLSSFTDQSGNGLSLTSPGNAYELQLTTGDSINSWGTIPCFHTQPGSRLDTPILSLTSTGFTVISVYKQNTSGNLEIPIICGSGNVPLIGQNIYGTGNRFILASSSTDWDESTNYVTHTNGYICTTSLSSGMNFANMGTVNRTRISSTTAWTNTVTQLSTLNFFGANYNLGSFAMVAFLIYPRVLTMSEVLIVEGFFANKLGINSLLGSDHPYVANPPF